MAGAIDRALVIQKCAIKPPIPTVITHITPTPSGTVIIPKNKVAARPMISCIEVSQKRMQVMD